MRSLRELDMGYARLRRWIWGAHLAPGDLESGCRFAAQGCGGAAQGWQGCGYAAEKG
ncbi:MAG: hypothetical protein JJU29_23930 [Verrucomicrobia bacterium]|nr:hypothetical protein [Verrucomicrobiota bacterium]